MAQGHRLNPPPPDSTQQLVAKYFNWIGQSIQGIDPNTALMAATEMAKAERLDDIAISVRQFTFPDTLSVRLETPYSVPLEIKGEIEVNHNTGLDVVLKTLYEEPIDVVLKTPEEPILVKGEIDISR